MNSADIRIDNKRRIYKSMLDGTYYTKQQISKKTGLSVATCNTLLNELRDCGYLTVSEQKEFHEAGRASYRFKIHAQHEHYIFVNTFIQNKKRIVDFYICDALGSIQEKIQKDYEFLTLELLQEEVRLLVNARNNIRQILFTFPGVIRDDLLCYTDIKELEGKNLMEIVKETNLSVTMINDLHAVAFGFESFEQAKNDVVTFAGFAKHQYPGTVTMHKGQVISGSHGIAGLVGFMPFDQEMEKLPELMVEGTCVPILCKTIGAVIALLNPSRIICTGDLINEAVLLDVRSYCAKSVPEQYMPTFNIVSDFNSYLLKGLFHLAIEKKIF